MEGPRYSPSLTELPSEVVFEHLLPALDLKDIAALSKINKQYHGLSVSPISTCLPLAAPEAWSDTRSFILMEGTL